MKQVLPNYAMCLPEERSVFTRPRQRTAKRDDNRQNCDVTPWEPFSGCILARHMGNVTPMRLRRVQTLAAQRGTRFGNTVLWLVKLKSVLSKGSQPSSKPLFDGGLDDTCGGQIQRQSLRDQNSGTDFLFSRRNGRRSDVRFHAFLLGLWFFELIPLCTAMLVASAAHCSGRNSNLHIAATSCARTYWECNP